MTQTTRFKHRTQTPGDEASRYDVDFLAWLTEQAAILRHGRLDAIDAANLAEELDDLGKTERARLESALTVLLMHMLKWDQQPEQRSRSWAASIREQRRRIARLLEQSPSLKAHRENAIQNAYADARSWASIETRIVDHDFPETCSYSWNDMTVRPFDVDPG